VLVECVGSVLKIKGSNVSAKLECVSFCERKDVEDLVLGLKLTDGTDDRREFNIPEFMEDNMSFRAMCPESSKVIKNYNYAKDVLVECVATKWQTDGSNLSAKLQCVSFCENKDVENLECQEGCSIATIDKELNVTKEDKETDMFPEGAVVTTTCRNKTHSVDATCSESEFSYSNKTKKDFVPSKDCPSSATSCFQVVTL
jgi:hypothetical protein